MTVVWNPVPGETPIDISGLKISGVNNREELAVVEAENVRKAIVKYMGGSLTRRTAKFDLTWMLKLHREMFGNVWKWAGETRTDSTDSVEVFTRGLISRNWFGERADNQFCVFAVQD